MHAREFFNYRVLIITFAVVIDLKDIVLTKSKMFFTLRERLFFSLLEQIFD